MDSFVLVAHASLVASRILLQRLQACLNFTSDLEDSYCWYKSIVKNEPVLFQNDVALILNLIGKNKMQLI